MASASAALDAAKRQDAVYPGRDYAAAVASAHMACGPARTLSHNLQFGNGDCFHSSWYLALTLSRAACLHLVVCVLSACCKPPLSFPSATACARVRMLRRTAAPGAVRPRMTPVWQSAGPPSCVLHPSKARLALATYGPANNAVESSKSSLFCGVIGSHHEHAHELSDTPCKYRVAGSSSDCQAIKAIGDCPFVRAMWES